MIKLRIGVKHLFQESIASFKNPIPFLPSDSSSLKKNRHGQILEVVPKYLNDTTIDNKDIETKLSKVTSIKQKLTNISSSFFNYEDITTEKASITAVSESLSNYNASTALSKYKSDFKQFKKIMPLLTCTVSCNGNVIAANNLNEEQYLRLSNDDVNVIVQDICKHKCKYLEMMNLIPAQQPKVEVNERKVNSFYDINDINTQEDVRQQLGNFKLFNESNVNKRNVPRSERSVVFPQQQQQQQLQYMNMNERKLPKTFEMDPYSQQSKANMSMYNYNMQHHNQQQQMKPKTMLVNPYANNKSNNNENSFVQRQQQQQQRLPYTNIQQQLNPTQSPYQTYSHNQQERIDFNKFKQNLFFPHEQHNHTNSTNTSSKYNEFRRIINNINIPDTEISKYLNEYTDNVIIAAERYFQSKYNTPELTIQYIYSQTFRKTHTFSFLARVDELFSQVSMDMPNLPHYKLLFQTGMEITKEMAASFKCIGALDIKNNSLIYIQPL